MSDSDRPRIGELPPLQRYQHDQITESTRATTDENGKVVGYTRGARVITVSTLDWLKSRKLLAHDFWAAGKRLYRDFYEAGLSPQITMRFKDYISGAGARWHSESQLGSREDFNAAMRAIGSELNDLVFDVVCFDKTLGQCEAARRWRDGTGLAVLNIALQQLHEHYERTKKA